MITFSSKPSSIRQAALAALTFVCLSLKVVAQEQVPSETPAEAPLPNPSVSDSLVAPGDWLHWKIFNLRPRLATSVTYDDNVSLLPTNELQDIIFTVSPGIAAVAGEGTGEKFFSFNYGISILKFVDHDQFDAIDHSARTTGLLPFAKLTLGGSASFDRLSTPQAGLGIRVERMLYTLALTAKYDISPKTSVELNGAYSKTDYDDSRLISSDTLTGQTFVNNQISSKVNVGLGLVFGALEQDQGPSQTFQQALLRAIYTLTYKLDLTAAVGVEFRQFEGYDRVIGTLQVITNTMPPTTNFFRLISREEASDSFNPVFDIGATYRPRDGTVLTLNAFRRDENSPTLAGYNYTTTGFNVGARQKFMERFSVSLGGGFQNSSYHASLENLSVDREDNYYLVQAGLDVLITQRWVAGLVVLYRGSDSNDPSGTIFDNKQVILQTSYSF